MPLCAVGKVAFETVRYATEGDFVPGNIFRTRQGDLKTFLTGRMRRCGEAATVKEMDLIYMGNADHGEWGVHDDLRAGLFKGFATRGFRSCFTVFHETGR